VQTKKRKCKDSKGVRVDGSWCKANSETEQGNWYRLIKWMDLGGAGTTGKRYLEKIVGGGLGTQKCHLSRFGPEEKAELCDNTALKVGGKPETLM